MIRTSQIKPYIVFIKPPLFDKLKETRGSSHARSTFDEHNSRGFTVSFVFIIVEPDGSLSCESTPDTFILLSYCYIVLLLLF